MKTVICLLFVISFSVSAQTNETIQSFGREFFAWRALSQPATGDDIPRVERPDGWTPDFSPEALIRYRKAYRRFHDALEAMPKSGWTRADSVDYLLLRSAVERVNWELNLLRLPNRNPDFYVHQTLGAVYELLLIAPPMTDVRARNIVARVKSIPATLEHAKVNLTEPVEPFADIALEKLQGVGERLSRMAEGLKRSMAKSYHGELDVAVDKASVALEAFASWIERKKPSMTREFSVGREGYNYFLKNIALLPLSPEELLLMGNLEWNRSVAFDVYEQARDADVIRPKLFASADDQIQQSRKDEESIRKFLEEKNIMTVPGWVHHYGNRKLPDELRPLAGMGVTDDLTSETRLDEDGVSYIPDPSPNLPFFSLASAEDPRPLIVHEGIPGHYFQLVRSWANPDPIRRHYFDSGPNEGIGFYVEELMLQFGLFDDRPRTREIIYRFMRLRALRVNVDVNLALGSTTIDEAGKELASTVPMDLETGVGEARFFAYNPGQAISYQVGKLQILKLIADAKIQRGDEFSLRDYHDYMMVNGNVPIALQRWEYLGLDDEARRLW